MVEFPESSHRARDSYTNLDLLVEPLLVACCSHEVQNVLKKRKYIDIAVLLGFPYARALHFLVRATRSS